jgi:hypothetical protein
VATDLQGRVVWYYDVQQTNLDTLDSDMLAPGGTVFVLGNDQYATTNPAGGVDVLREIDLAGDTLRETNIPAVNAQLIALGYHPVYGFHHDAERLPNGDTAVLTYRRQMVLINGQREPYVGDDVIVLDRNFQVRWAWDSFDWLDVNRGPTLGEDLGNFQGNPIVDWLHTNAVTWSPADGNLLLSLRSQDWVIKIDYANGTGDGHVVWRLGIGGDFTLVGAHDRYPWFTHQHDARYTDDSTLVLFDDGNVRCLNDPTCDSRGQEWQLDEQAMTATPLLNADLGIYSSGVGSAQRLSNGNFSFDAGLLGNVGNLHGQSIEVRPDGSITYNLEEQEAPMYRAFRMGTLYNGVSQAVDNGPSASPVTDPIPAANSNPAVPETPRLVGGSLPDWFAGAGMPDPVASSTSAAVGAASRAAPAPLGSRGLPPSLRQPTLSNSLGDSVWDALAPTA